jgi:sec-independent protein translocase protein TatC
MTQQPQPLLSHFRELRNRVVRSAIAIVLASGVGWVFYTDIINQLASPICQTKISLQSSPYHCGVLYINGVLGPLNLQIKIALLVGIIISSPIWIYQLWAFLAPGLYRKEKLRSLLFFSASIPFFASGAYLGYRLIPIAVRVLLGFTPHSLTNLVRFDDYLDFVLRVIIIFGIAFELPVFLIGLNLLGVISGKAILKPWRLAIFLIALFTAMFTPTGDPLTMSLLALPLVIFYFTAGFVGLFVDRRRERLSLHEEN